MLFLLSVQASPPMIAEVDRALLDLGHARRGDAVVIVAGTPPGVTGNTNTIRVQVVGGS